MKTLRYIIFLAILPVVITACSDKQEGDVSQTPAPHPSLRKMAASEFPSSDTQTLQYNIDAFSDAEINCPVAARYAAMYELLEGYWNLLNDLRMGYVYAEGGQNEQITHDDYMTDADWTLTTNPRAIYDYDGSIKYYEFGLIEDDEVTATITVYAKREAPHAIAFMFPYILPYEHTDKDYYVGDYPHRVFYDGIGYRDIEDSEHIRYISLDTTGYWEQIYAQSTSEEILEWERLKQEVNNGDTEYQTESEAFWDAVSGAINEVSQSQEIDDPCVTDSRPPKYIENTYIEHLKDVLGGGNYYCRDYTARNYCEAAIQQTFWDAGCGPAALAWVYRGLYSNFPRHNGSYLPIHGDSRDTYFRTYTQYSNYCYGLNNLDSLCWTNYCFVKQAYMERSIDVDNGLTAIFFDRCIAVKQNSWQFLMLPCKLNSAFIEATDSIFGVSGDNTASFAANWIHDYNLPVILLVRELDHYLVAYGYGGISDTYGGDISRTNLFFLVTDNGYTINDGDRHYKPYWREYRTREYYHCVEHINL